MYFFTCFILSVCCHLSKFLNIHLIGTFIRINLNKKYLAFVLKFVKLQLRIDGWNVKGGELWMKGTMKYTRNDIQFRHIRHMRTCTCDSHLHTGMWGPPAPYGQDLKYLLILVLCKVLSYNDLSESRSQWIKNISVKIKHSEVIRIFSMYYCEEFRFFLEYTLWNIT